MSSFILIDGASRGPLGTVSPQALNVRGSTQPELFQGTVDAMAQAIRADAARFWRDSCNKDGPIEIWEINGERFIYNGNHRFHAAVQTGTDIPDFAIKIVSMAGSSIPTFPLNQLTWLPGLK